MSRASTRSEPGGLAAALSLWSVRALLVLFAIGTLVGVLSLAEGARLRAEIRALEAARRFEALLDSTAEAVRALERRIETARSGAVADPWALEVQAVRDRLQALQAGAPPGARFTERPLLEEVARIEAAGRLVAGGTPPSPAVTSELRAALEQRWSAFHEAVHEETHPRGVRTALAHRRALPAAALGAALRRSRRGGDPGRRGRGHGPLRCGARAAQARALAAGDFAGAAAPAGDRRRFRRPARRHRSPRPRP